ncbi:MAG: DNA primase [Acidobacteriota bacterium]
MKYDSAFIERLRSAVNIVDVVGAYVPLRRHGKNWSGLCPFHQDKDPSFNVNEAHQFFKCFGCGVGGDVFAFVQQIENVPFPEAVRMLAEKAGLPLPAPSAKEAAVQTQVGRLRELMQEAAAWFRAELERSPKALAYLENRGIDRATIDAFGLGYAPPGNRLLQHFTAQRVAAEELEACGLVGRSEGGSYYDKFRDRVVFPIRDSAGRVIAFGGRILGEGQPKYLNSPETPLYHKGSHLFALSEARDAIRKARFAIVVEGYFDAVVPHQFGFKNVVASLGTSLTEEQARLLARFCKRVVLCFDPDAAGIRAALRSIEIFLGQGFEISILQLPGGDDPDAFLRRNGAEAYREALRRAQPCFEFLLNHLASESPSSLTPRQKQEVVDRFLPFVAQLPKQIERVEWAAQLAARLALPEEVILAELRRLARTGVRRPGANGEAGQPVQRMRTPGWSRLTLAEQMLVAALLDETLREEVVPELDPLLVEGLPTENLIRRWKEGLETGDEVDIHALRESLDAEDRELLDHLLVKTAELQVAREDLAACFESLRELQLGRLSRRIRQEIQLAERNGAAPERLRELLQRQADLQRMKKR